MMVRDGDSAGNYDSYRSNENNELWESGRCGSKGFYDESNDHCIAAITVRDGGAGLYNKDNKFGQLIDASFLPIFSNFVGLNSLWASLGQFGEV